MHSPAWKPHIRHANKFTGPELEVLIDFIYRRWGARQDARNPAVVLFNSVPYILTHKADGTWSMERM